MLIILYLVCLLQNGEPDQVSFQSTKKKDLIDPLQFEQVTNRTMIIFIFFSLYLWINDVICLPTCFNHGIMMMSVYMTYAMLQLLKQLKHDNFKCFNCMLKFSLAIVKHSWCLVAFYCFLSQNITDDLSWHAICYLGCIDVCSVSIRD